MASRKVPNFPFPRLPLLRLHQRASARKHTDMSLPASQKPTTQATDTELRWIRKPTEHDEREYQTYRPPESFGEKVRRKTKANPMVPIGVGATTLILGYGLWQMRKGNTKMSQNMMRARVASQGLTIVALVLGVVYAGQAAR